MSAASILLAADCSAMVGILHLLNMASTCILDRSPEVSISARSKLANLSNPWPMPLPLVVSYAKFGLRPNGVVREFSVGCWSLYTTPQPGREQQLAHTHIPIRTSEMAARLSDRLLATIEHKTTTTKGPAAAETVFGNVAFICVLLFTYAYTAWSYMLAKSTILAFTMLFVHHMMHPETLEARTFGLRGNRLVLTERTLATLGSVLVDCFTKDHDNLLCHVPPLREFLRESQGMALEERRLEACWLREAELEVASPGVGRKIALVYCRARRGHIHMLLPLALAMSMIVANIYMVIVLVFDCVAQLAKAVKQ